jgi:hypothetical protein
MAARTDALPGDAGFFPWLAAMMTINRTTTQAAITTALCGFLLAGRLPWPDGDGRISPVLPSGEREREQGHARLLQ